ncbi:MAG TPA: ATP-binding protein [Isosphaeraceae bacterium]|nr:ATP-binding protein [Isosphaeraceae bacterium]
MNMPLINLELRIEADIVLARQRARQIAALLGFAHLDQARIATATSEIARNAIQYAGGGRVEFVVETGAAPKMLIRILERGPGINDLNAILEGEYISPTGLGLGIIGAKRLMDQFAVDTGAAAGATVSMSKTLPSRTSNITPQEIARLSAELARQAPSGLLAELQQQNQELLNTLQELRDRQAEIAQIHSRELDETNRGVVALYAELEEGTKDLQRLSDLKSRFLSEMSHEFRSPLNSIKGLTGFLLDRTDGDLSSEQEKQIQFIRQAADGLSTLVDDLLDLARVEAGKAAIRVSSFEVRSLFESLHGMIRPMLDQGAVALVFEESTGIPNLNTDEGKVAQILRNFLTNAVKFTERGEIRVSARRGQDDVVTFSVKDSGIGIAPENLNRVFEEYGQIDNPLQNRVKGTGLGLPLTRKLAQLLGGSVSVQSDTGVGSTFSVAIPRVFPRDERHEAGFTVLPAIDRLAALRAIEQRAAIEIALIVDDEERDRYLVKGALSALGAFDVVEAERGEEALLLARSHQPDVIFLDLILPDMSGFEILDVLKSEEKTRNIPVIIHTSEVLNDEKRRRLNKDAVAIVTKGSKSREEAIAQIRDSLSKAGLRPPVHERAEF